MSGASWADEIGSSPSYRVDATSNNNYCGEYSVATDTFSNNVTHPPSTSHFKKVRIKFVPAAGDEPINPDALFCSIIEGDEADTFNEYPANQKTSANPKRTVTPDNISQNDTSHHAQKRLKKSDESEPGANNDDSRDFLCYLNTGDDSDTDDDSGTTNAATNNHVSLPKRSGVSYEGKRMINELRRFRSKFGEAELESLFAELKVSGDDSKKMGHPRPTSPSILPAVIENILGETGLDEMLVVAGGEVMNNNDEDSQFNLSIKGQLGCFFQLMLEPFACDAQSRDAQLKHIIKEFYDQRHIGQVAIEDMNWIYNGGPVVDLERIDALESVQLLHYATLETYKRASEKQRKEGDICSPLISKTVMKLYKDLRRIAQRNGKDVSLETLTEAIFSVDILPFIASEVFWMKFGKDKPDPDEEVNICD